MYIYRQSIQQTLILRIQYLVRMYYSIKRFYQPQTVLCHVTNGQSSFLRFTRTGNVEPQSQPFLFHVCDLFRNECISSLSRPSRGYHTQPRSTVHPDRGVVGDVPPNGYSWVEHDVTLPHGPETVNDRSSFWVKVRHGLLSTVTTVTLTNLLQ